MNANSQRAARRAYADVVSTCAIRNSDGDVIEPKRRVRRHRSQPFRAWARDAYAKQSPLSPKLAAIVHGKALTP